MANKIQTMLAALLILSLVTLSGCGSTDTADTAMKPQPVVKEEPLAAGPQSIEDDAHSHAPLEGRTSAPMRPVYFDFDSSFIRDDQVARIIRNAEFIQEFPDVSIRIEGNCDSRGTNEYNMALGERRALNAKRYLVDLGVKEENLDTVSYGEEQLLLYGDDELSWAQNRRADFVLVE